MGNPLVQAGHLSVCIACWHHWIVHAVLRLAEPLQTLIAHLDSVLQSGIWRQVILAVATARCQMDSGPERKMHNRTALAQAQQARKLPSVAERTCDAPS